MAGVVDGPLFVDESFRQREAKYICDTDCCMLRIEKATLLENREDFVRLVNELSSDGLYFNLGSIRSYIFMWDSPECAAAVLDGETEISNIPRLIPWLLQLDNGHLHRAASSAAFKVAALLLQRGFSADVRADFEMLKAVLPLDIVMSNIRSDPGFHVSGSPPVQLVLQLSKLSMRRKLETLRVIALNTADVKPVFFKYLKEGRMVEVGALLMVARSRVLSSSTLTAKGEFRSISEMHDFVSNAKCLLSTSATAGDKNKLVEMEATLVLLQIFDKIGNKLAALLRLDLTAFDTSDRCFSSYVAESLIRAAGFDVKPKIVNSNNATTRDSAVDVVSYVMQRCIDESNKPALTTDVMPSSVKEAVLRGLGDKSGNTSRFTSFVAIPPSGMNSVSVSPGSVPMLVNKPLSSGSVPMLVNYPLLQHLANKASPFLRTIARLTSLRR